MLQPLGWKPCALIYTHWDCSGPVSCTEMPAGAANRSMRAAVKAFADAGGVVYAECGGLLYLSQSLQPLNELPCSMGAPD